MQPTTVYAYLPLELHASRRLTSGSATLSAKSSNSISAMSAIFLDRDGVLIRKAPEGEYVGDWAEVEFLPRALEATAAFSRSGWMVVIITNQRGVATGKVQETKLHEIHANIDRAIARHGGVLTAVYYCPHDIPVDCECRKPRPGMLLRAAAEHGLYLPECWMVGDAVSDIAAGKAAGCKTAFIGVQQQAQVAGADVFAASLADVAESILRSSTKL